MKTVPWDQETRRSITFQQSWQISSGGRGSPALSHRHMGNSEIQGAPLGCPMPTFDSKMGRCSSLRLRRTWRPGAQVLQGCWATELGRSAGWGEGLDRRTRRMNVLCRLKTR